MSDLDIREYLKSAPKFELQPINKQKNFSENHVVYSGIINRHKEASDRLVLVCGFGTGNTFFYEFFIKDIDRVEKVETVVATNGQALQVVRLWVKKGALAFRYEPFVVTDNTEVFRLT